MAQHNHNLFGTLQPAPQPVARQRCFTEAEQDELFRKQYARCLDSRGRAIGKVKGERAYHAFNEMLAKLEDSPLAKMRAAQGGMDTTKFDRAFAASRELPKTLLPGKLF